MKLQFIAIFLIVTFKIKSAETPHYINKWVVWNIGQGQWVTHILPDECIHYDVGGEFGSFNKVKKPLLFYCGKKVNSINLSHWDYDHFLNIPFLARSIPRLCWQHKPEFGSYKKIAAKVLSLNIPVCAPSFHYFYSWTPKQARDTNASSTIFYDEQVLLTGDSTTQQEKIWSNEFKIINQSKILLLGHHGSKTSTGRNLLQQLPQLIFSISSARFAKYKHPHKDTLKRLSEFNIPVLKTEDWGNIWFQ